MLEAPVVPVGVPALLAEYRREKRAAPSMMTHSVGSAAPVSREAAELAASELRSILGQQGTQGVAACGVDTSPQPLSPTVSVPSSPAPTPVPAALVELDLHDHGPESTSATTHAHSYKRAGDGLNGGKVDDLVVTTASTTAAFSTSRALPQATTQATTQACPTLVRHSSFDDDDIGGFFSYDARRRRQMMALQATTSESDASSSEEEDTSDDEGGLNEVSTIAGTGRHKSGFRERVGRRSRATILRGGMLAALWASKMLLRSRARREGRRLGPRSHRPLIPQKWLETPSHKVRGAQAEQGAYQAYLKLQLMEEKELSLSTPERILVEFPVWLLVPTALIVYMLLQVSQTLGDQREL